MASGVQQFGLVFRAWLHFIFAGVRSSLLRSGRALRRFFLPRPGCGRCLGWSPEDIEVLRGCTLILGAQSSGLCLAACKLLRCN